MIEKIKKFVVNYKHQVVGGTGGVIAYFMIVFPIILNALLSISGGFLFIWASIGIAILLFLLHIILGIILGYAVKYIREK